MVFDVSITGFDKNGNKLFSLDTPWISGFELMSDDRFEEVEGGNNGYLDMSASLTVEEMKELHNKYSPDKKSYKQETYGKEMKFLDDAFNVYKNKLSRFNVWLAEW